MSNPIKAAISIGTFVSGTIVMSVALWRHINLVRGGSGHWGQGRSSLCRLIRVVIDVKRLPVESCR
jgi:hypothetical protein